MPHPPQPLVPHLAWTLPFVALLLAIAVLPLVPAARHWWERNRSKLALALALSALTIGYYGLRGTGIAGLGAGHDATAPGLETVVAVLRHALVGEYLPFMVLLLSLYVIAGGIVVRGDIRATPAANTAILATGGVLASLIGIYLALGIGRGVVPAGERWAVRVPFSVYLGWVSVATIANVTDVLDFVKWNGWGLEPAAWAAIMLGIGVVLAAVVAFTRHDAAYVLVFVWAYIGIALKQASAPLLPMIAWPAVVVLVVLAVTAAMGELRRLRQAASK